MGESEDGMKRFAVAFATTGDSPKNGDRFSVIVMVGDEDGQASGERKTFQLASNETTDAGVKFVVALETMKSLVGESSIVVHDAGRWRRFLRAELRTIKRHGAGNLMNNVVDVIAWAHQRFPRQRKEVTAIARRAGIEFPMDLSGLELEAELLRRIGSLILKPTGSTEPIGVAAENISSDEMGIVLPSARINWVERMGYFWRILMRKG